MEEIKDTNVSGTNENTANLLARESENPPKVLTRSEYKAAMRTFFTQRHATVTPCGHKFHPTAEPKNNCQYCWFCYYNEHGEVTQTAEECFQKEGADFLIKLRGKKFFKNFLKFMATLAQYQAIKEKEQNGNKQPEGSGSSGLETTGSIGGIDGLERQVEGSSSGRSIAKQTV